MIDCQSSRGMCWVEFYFSFFPQRRDPQYEVQLLQIVDIFRALDTGVSSNCSSLPVSMTGVLDQDEYIKGDTTLEQLQKLKPAFQKAQSDLLLVNLDG